MILKTDYNALVLVGIWNKGIFNHDWVSRFLLPKEEKLDVEFPLNIDASPRISSEKIRIYVVGNKLNFVPLNTYDETYEIIQELAIKTADYLPHTPVTAFGINFIFEEELNNNLKDLLKINDTEKLTGFGTTIKKTQHNHSLTYENLQLNLSITAENSKTLFNYNFHFSISNLTEFKEQVITNQLLELKKIALNISKDVYSLELKQ